MNQRGFTLPEVLVAIGVFSVAAVIAAQLLMDTVKMERKTAIESGIYEDTKIILQQLTNEIQSSSIDYEEYYNIHVIQHDAEDKYYGANYGAYASRFYDPGKQLDRNTGGIRNIETKNPDHLGTDCAFPNDRPADDKCEIVFTHSSDIKVGRNPFVGNETLANAFCDNGQGSCEGFDALKELYLIDSSGREKTIIARRLMSTGVGGIQDWAIGMVKMRGRDLDQNGKIDIFGCDEQFNCVDGQDNEDPSNRSREEEDALKIAFKYPFIEEEADANPDLQNSYFKLNNIRLPSSRDLNSVFEPNTSHFLPISPRRANIKSLHFIVTPLEDPYKAFAEEAVQAHPSVTIIMTVGLSDDAAADYPGEFPDLTVQTTVAAGVIGSPESYPPIRDLRFEGEESSWLKDKVISVP